MFELLRLDPNTIFLLYFWGNFFTCLLIFSYALSYATSDNKKILHWFGVGKFFLTIAWVLILLRTTIYDFLSINVANSMIFYSCCYETMAMTSLLKSNTRKRYHLQIAITITVIVIFNIVTFMGGSVNTRVLIAGLGVFAIYLPPTIHYFTEKTQNFFRLFYVLCYIGFEILLIIRTIYRFIYPKNDMLSYDALDSLYSIGLFLLSLVGIVGFLFLVKEKQDNKIQKLLDDKDKFFSIISHDLRGPMGASVSLSELLVEDLEEYNQDEIREISQMLYQSNKNIYKLLENLLEWSRVQTGMITFIPEKLVLNNLIEENVAFCQNSAAYKNITMSFDADELIEVEADKNMIDTILRNLLSNAIKFTDKDGEIRIHLSKANNTATISVIDNGIGIPDKIKENLFTISAKAIQKGTGNETGSGLGLLLCAEFIKMHKGTINVNSQAGKGSTFTFTIPTTQTV